MLGQLYGTILTLPIDAMEVAVGSTNPIKIQAVKNGFNDANIQVVPCIASSNVRSQPLSDDETLRGAINRAKDCLDKTECKLAIGLEAGVVVFEQQLFLSHWGALVDRDQNVYFTNGPLILLPGEYHADLFDGKNLEEIMHRSTGIDSLGSKEGAIGVFTQNRLNREQVLTQIVKVLVGQYGYYQNCLSKDSIEPKAPENIFQDFDREDLNLDNLSMTQLSEEIGCLTKLKRLSLYKNRLSKLPDSIFHLYSLERLNSSANQLTFLPDEIANLKNLEVLDLNHNRLHTLPPGIGKLEKLKFLYLANNRLKDLPSLNKLKNLLYLNISENQFADLPSIVGEATDLIELRIYHNQIHSLPEAIGNLKKLKELHAMHNEISCLHENIGKLSCLRKLILENNRLESLPNSIGDLENLTDLDLRTNRLHSIPESLGKLKSLRFLDLRNNQLKSLPTTLLNLPHLEKLDLRLNHDLIIPKWVEKLEERGCTVFY